MGQGLVKNYGGLVAMRFLVGLFEAGLVPGRYDPAARRAHANGSKDASVCLPHTILDLNYNGD
jgi:hypothetical protein